MKPKKLTCSQFFVFEDLAFFPTVFNMSGASLDGCKGSFWPLNFIDYCWVAYRFNPSIWVPNEAPACQEHFERATTTFTINLWWWSKLNFFLVCLLQNCIGKKMTLLAHICILHRYAWGYMLYLSFPSIICIKCTCRCTQCFQMSYSNWNKKKT